MSYLSLIPTGLRTRVDVSITISTDGRTFPTELTFMPSHALLQQATAGACHAIQATGLRRNYATIRSHTVSFYTNSRCIRGLHKIARVCNASNPYIRHCGGTKSKPLQLPAQLLLLAICRAFSCTCGIAKFAGLENDGLESDRLENDGVEQEETDILHTIK